MFSGLLSGNFSSRFFEIPFEILSEISLGFPSRHFSSRFSVIFPWVPLGTLLSIFPGICTGVPPGISPVGGILSGVPARISRKFSLEVFPRLLLELPEFQPDTLMRLVPAVLKEFLTGIVHEFLSRIIGGTKYRSFLRISLRGSLNFFIRIPSGFFSQISWISPLPMDFFSSSLWDLFKRFSRDFSERLLEMCSTVSLENSLERFLRFSPGVPPCLNLSISWILYRISWISPVDFSSFLLEFFSNFYWSSPRFLPEFLLFGIGVPIRISREPLGFLSRSFEFFQELSEDFFLTSSQGFR